MPRTSALQRAHEVLNHIDLGEARYRPVESYSTGMKQRLKLAAALAHDPRLLILDEPTNGLDPAGRQDMLALARDLAHGKGINVLFSSHLLPDVEHVCDHVLVLGGGRLLAQGKIAELKEPHLHTYDVRLKGEPTPFARRLGEAGCTVDEIDGRLLVRLPDGVGEQVLWAAAAAGGDQIRHLRPRRSTLEEVFLRALDGDTDTTVTPTPRAAASAVRG
jgi:ABC-2 type transport system ATP-binding protein